MTLTQLLNYDVAIDVDVHFHTVFARSWNSNRKLGGIPSADEETWPITSYNARVNFASSTKIVYDNSREHNL